MNLLKHMRKFEGTVVKKLSHNVFRKDFTRMLNIYSIISKIGANVKIFY